MSRIPPPPPRPAVIDPPEAEDTTTAAVATAVAPAKPVRRKAAPRLVAPPTRVDTPNNLKTPTEGWADLNFKVSHEYRQAFKLEAVRRGMSMKELLEIAMEHYRKDFPLEG